MFNKSSIDDSINLPFSSYKVIQRLMSLSRDFGRLSIPSTVVPHDTERQKTKDLSQLIDSYRYERFFSLLNDNLASSAIISARAQSTELASLCFRKKKLYF